MFGARESNLSILARLAGSNRVNSATGFARSADLRSDAGWIGLAGTDARSLAGTYRHGEGFVGRLRARVRDGVLLMSQDVPKPVSPRDAEPPQGTRIDGAIELSPGSLSGH